MSRVLEFQTERREKREREKESLLEELETCSTKKWNLL